MKRCRCNNYKLEECTNYIVDNARLKIELIKLQEINKKLSVKIIDLKQEVLYYIMHGMPVIK